HETTLAGGDARRARSVSRLARGYVTEGLCRAGGARCNALRAGHVHKTLHPGLGVSGRGGYGARACFALFLYPAAEAEEVVGTADQGCGDGKVDQGIDPA